MDSKPVIYYDGHCKLCKSSIQFILKRDKKRQFRYIPLQQSGLQNVNEIDYDTVVLEYKGKLFTKSDAVIQVLLLSSKLKFQYYLLYLFPVCVRNLVYDCVARNRKRWFGEQNTCYVPTNQNGNYC